MKDRNQIIDICKGLGILFVVLGHTGVPFGKVISGFHMGLFFFLAGYCFSDSHIQSLKSWGKYIIKRFNRLIVPLLLFPALAFLFIPVEGQSWGTMFKRPDRLFDAFWFLRSLFIVNVLGSVMIVAGGGKKYLISLTPLLAFFPPYIVYEYSIGVAHYFYYTFFYLVGYMIKHNEIDMVNRWHVSISHLLLTGFAFCLLVLLSYYNHTIIQRTNCSNFASYAIGTFSGVFLIMILSKYLQKQQYAGKLFVLLGQFTMPIFIFNVTSYVVLDYIIQYFNINIPYVVAYKILKTCFAIVFAILLDVSYLYLKRYCLGLVGVNKD